LAKEQTRSVGKGKPYRTEMVKLSQLKPHPRNYRQHPPDQLNHVVASIESNGLYRNVVVANDDVIVAGHAVVEACRAMKMTQIPVVRLAIKSDHPKALKVLAGDNQIGELAQIDDRALTEMLKEIMEGEDLLGTGFDDQMLAARMFVTRHRTEVAQFDEAAEWVGMPDYDPGEVRYMLVMHFRSLDDREKFVKQKKIEVSRETTVGEHGQMRTWSAWWPPEEKADRKSARWEEDGG
jgi:hypothetical protein